MVLVEINGRWLAFTKVCWGLVGKLVRELGVFAVFLSQDVFKVDYLCKVYFATHSR